MTWAFAFPLTGALVMRIFNVSLAIVPTTVFDDARGITRIGISLDILFWQIYTSLAPRVAAKDTPGGFECTDQKPSLFHNLLSIFTTAGVVLTIPEWIDRLCPKAMVWRQHFLVETNCPDCNVSGYVY